MLVDVGYGDGTITLRGDGRLMVRVWMEGRPVYRFIAARRVAQDAKAARKEAERIRSKLVERRDAGADPSSQTLEVYLRSWLESLREARHARVRPRTLDHYELVIERHIIPGLGQRRLDRLRESHVQAWLDRDAAAPRTVAHHRAVLRRALNVAVRQRVLERNPAIAVELPPVPEYRAAVLSRAEARALLAATADDRLGPMWRLALDSGFRLSELLGLAWDDLDLEAGTVTLGAQLQRRGGAWIRTEPKAARTLATISLAPSTVAALERHRMSMAGERTPDWAYHGLVFVTPAGQPWHASKIRLAFLRACDAAGIPRRRVHDLRASSLTLLREAGIAEDVRMARAGHSTTAMARHYSDGAKGIDRPAAEALEQALGG